MEEREKDEFNLTYIAKRWLHHQKLMGVVLVQPNCEPTIVSSGLGFPLFDYKKTTEIVFSV